MSAKSTQGYNDYPAPVGSVVAYAGSITDGKMPSLYLVCDGTSVLEADYPELFRVIGANFGSVGAGEFNLPNLVGFTPKCANVAGVVSATSSSTVVIAPITLSTQELPTINNIAIGANISGNFDAGSSTSSTGKIDENTLFPDRNPMTSWNTTSTVDMASNSAPVFNYSNGSGVVAPIEPVVSGADTVSIANIEMVFIIKAKSGFF